jgi:hypothetical protein
MSNSWHPKTIDFQFSKSGPWCTNVNYPENPCIVKPSKLVPIIDSPIDIYQTIEVIKSLLPDSKDFLDNPILIINRIEKLNLTNAKKAHYYRYLYLYTKSTVPMFTMKKLYTKYYDGYCLNGLGYTWKERERINKCQFSDLFISDLYKDAFFEYSRYY